MYKIEITFSDDGHFYNKVKGILFKHKVSFISKNIENNQYTSLGYVDNKSIMLSIINRNRLLINEIKNDIEKLNIKCDVLILKDEQMHDVYSQMSIDDLQIKTYGGWKC